MALRINLFQEINKQLVQRRRDPVRMGILVCLIIGVVVAVYYMYAIGSLRSLNGEMGRLDAEMKALSPQAEQAKKDADRMNADLTVVKMFKDRAKTRISWAPVLAKIIRIVPPSIQIIKFSGTAISDASYAITIAGIAHDPEARENADKLRVAFGQEFPKEYQVSSVFTNIDDARDGDKMAASFTIQVNITKPEPKKRETKAKATEE